MNGCIFATSFKWLLVLVYQIRNYTASPLSYVYQNVAVFHIRLSFPYLGIKEYKIVEKGCKDATVHLQLTNCSILLPSSYI